MTADPHDWFLTSQALDHHATVGALVNAMRPAHMGHDQELAEIVATELARAGFALVLVDRAPRPGTLAHDLVLAMEKEAGKRRDRQDRVTAMDIDAPGFLVRRED